MISRLASGRSPSARTSATSAASVERPHHGMRRARASGSVAALYGLLAVFFVALLLPVQSGAQVTVWVAVPGNPPSIPDDQFKYLDADEACRARFQLPPDDACSKAARNLHNVGGPQTQGGCLFETTCTCNFCATASQPTGGNTLEQPTRLATFGRTRTTCPPGQVLSVGVCAVDPPKTKGSCTGAAGGDSGGAGAAGNAGLGTFVGNPCNAVTGNKVETQTLYRSPGRLELVLTYNSQIGAGSFESGSFGTRWSSRYFARLRDSSQGVIPVQMPNGRELEFDAPPTGSVYTADADISDKLERITDSSGNFLEWHLTTSSGDEQFAFDATGHLLRIRSRTLQDETLTYSTGDTPIAPEAGYVISVSDPFGRQMNFTYDVNRRVVTMTDSGGGVYRFEYDGPSGPANANNLTKITFPDGQTRTYFYAEPAQINGGAACATPSPGLPNSLTGLQDENGVRYATWTYDCLGHVTSSAHAGGADSYTITYNANSRLIVDPLGTSRTMSLTPQRILGVAYNTGTTQPAASGAPSASSSLSYDANGNVASKTDFDGNVTTYTYDLTRNLQTSRVEAAGTPQARTISTQWHPAFRLPVAVAEPLRITSYVYNGDGGVNCGVAADGTLVPGVLCSKTIQPTSDATGTAGFGAASAGTARTWRYTYNANGSVLSMDGPRTDVADVTQYTYYANNDPDPGKRGNVASITNALGQVTQISSYNAHGQPLTIVDPNGLATNLSYDARLRLTSRNVGGEITTYGYDGVGQLLRVTLQDGSFLSYGYDAAHRLTGITDSAGNSIAYTLDPMGNRTREQVFDPGGSLAQTRSRVYDALNRLAQDIGAQSQTTQYAYDAQGNVTGVTDPLGHATANAYDALNRLVQVTDPGNGVTRYAYNGIDQLVSVSDPRNLTTSYSYDGLSNLNAQASPDTGSTANTYDAAGNLLTQTDAKDQTTTYAYDALNRVTSITFADGSTQNYGYDQGANGLGRLTFFAETNAANQITIVQDYAYDAHGRTIVENRNIGGVTYAFGYGYDTAGRLSGMSYPSGRTVAYGFDAAGRISQVSTTAPPATGGATQMVASNISYQPFGGVKSYMLGNGQLYARAYDQDGRIVAYGAGSQGASLGYDPAGRIVSIADATSSNTYGYDNLDRLTSAATPAGAFAYTYDPVGNRTSKTVGTATDTYAYSPTSNRLASISGSTSRSFSFDPNGSTIADGLNQYTYDARGRMVNATSPTGTAFYQVNALGQRVRKTTASDDRVFLYDLKGHLIAETSPAGAVLREYVYLNDIPLAVIQ